MKRIEDKINEIEKKDRTNRWLFYGIIVLIIGFLYYASTTQKTIKNQVETITDQGETIEKQLEDLQAKNIELQETIDRLEKSQTPIGFWNETNEAKNTSTYINYILHTGKPEATEEFKAIALENIKLAETQGETVWLYCGNKTADKITSKNVMKILHRKDASPSPDAVPSIGDLVENNTINRNTYKSFNNNNVSGPNNADKAWKKGSKAQVLAVEFSGPAVYIQIKF